MPSTLPVNYLRKTKNLLAFRHPNPSHPFHVVILPREEAKSLEELDPGNTTFFSDLISSVQSLVKEYNLPAYRLVVNGGAYQEFPYLHFHLISDSESNPKHE